MVLVVGFVEVLVTVSGTVLVVVVALSAVELEVGRRVAVLRGSPRVLSTGPWLVKACTPLTEDTEG